MPTSKEVGIVYKEWVILTDFTVKYEKRKTTAIHILPDGQVEVRAPRGVPINILRKFVNEYEDWIIKRQAVLADRDNKKELFEQNGPDTVRFLGKECRIEKWEEKRVTFDGETLFVPQDVPFSSWKQSVIKIYKKLALQFIKPRVDYFANIMGVTPSAVKISSAVHRWGSCSGRGNLNFSWRLIMAPQENVDYVVVHELAHLKEFNHSDKFWKIVSHVLPDYKKREKLLKDLQKELSNETWN